MHLFSAHLPRNTLPYMYITANTTRHVVHEKTMKVQWNRTSTSEKAIKICVTVFSLVAYPSVKCHDIWIFSLKYPWICMSTVYLWNSCESIFHRCTKCTLQWSYHEFIFHSNINILYYKFPLVLKTGKENLQQCFSGDTTKSCVSFAYALWTIL